MSKLYKCYVPAYLPRLIRAKSKTEAAEICGEQIDGMLSGTNGEQENEIKCELATDDKRDQLLRWADELLENDNRPEVESWRETAQELLSWLSLVRPYRRIMGQLSPDRC